jgi:hypothetical protein
VQEAVAVVVSEETGNVTVFSNRSVNRAETVQQLRDTLGLLFLKGGATGERG